MKLFAILSSLFLSTSVWAASCPMPQFTKAADVITSSDTVLIVTHPSTQWDGRFASKLGMDSTVKYVKKNQIPVIYLQESAPAHASSYFFADCNPHFWFSSDGGEFDFKTPYHHIITIGGHLEMCERTTTDQIMQNWANATGDLTLTFVMDAIYSDPDSSMSSSDSYFKRMQDFLSIITYGKPDPSEWPFPKTTLLENMGIIQDAKLQVEYLKRVMPSYTSLPRNYEVQLHVNGKLVEVLRAGSGEKRSVMKFEFINTLYKEGDPIPGIH